MNFSYKSLPLRFKLITITVAISAGAFGLAAVASLIVDYRDSRATFVERYEVLAQTMANNSRLLLAFDDANAASSLLSALSADSEVLSGVLLDLGADELARYGRESGGVLAARAPPQELPASRLVGDVLHVWTPIEEDSEGSASFYLQADAAELRTALQRKAAWMAFLGLLACAAAALVASRLQHAISSPILELAQVARSLPDDGVWEPAISRQRPSGDEIGVLQRAFYEMMNAMHEREEALRESEAKYRMLMEQASDGIVISDDQGRLLTVNQAVSDLLGYRPEELFGREAREFLAPGDGLMQSFPVEKLRQGEAVMAEACFLRKDGKRVWIETNTKMIEDGRIQTILRDLTERKRLEGQLLQSQKMDAVGQLAGGVAHDFNNLLTVIGGVSSHLLSRWPASPSKDDLSEIKAAASRAADLTRQLLAFSRQQILRPQVIDLNDRVASLKGMLDRIIEENIRLGTISAPRLGTVRVDAGQIEQVIVNLVVNARDAMPEGGELTIETRNVDVRSREEAILLEVPIGEWVCLEVRDSGTGIAPEHLPHVFEPFFTMKERGKGTGLGLSTLYGIVKQSEGHVAIRSEVGVGTAMQVYLPRLHQVPDDAASELELRGKQGSECILLVEDEPSVRRFTRRLLEKLGYGVIEAGNAEQARDLVSSYRDAIDLLLSDVVMPGQSGVELAYDLLEELPKLKVILMTGYPGDVLAASPGRHGAKLAVLPKPFDETSLASLIREQLDAG